MDLSVNPAQVLDKLAAALEAAAEAEGETGAPRDAAQTASAAPVRAEINTTLVQGGFVERILGDNVPTSAAPPADVPGTRVDRSMENATLQTHARPHATVPEPPRPSETAPQPGVQANAHAASDFAVPASLLVPATLTGLQVLHAGFWPVPGRGFDPDPQPLHRARVRGRDDPPPPPPPPVEEETEEEQPEAQAQTKEEPQPDAACGVLFQDDDDGAWCDELTRALRIALAAKVPPHALLGAAEQWRRGRCVVLACPQHADPTGPAWAFVLWPRKQARNADGSAPPLALFGLRVEARLQWSALPSGVKWCQVRVIKEHHPRSGRQLIPTTPGQSTGRVQCEVQLGPVLARPLRCCDVCVRIGAAQRFWRALGTQWSMQVIVASFPLIGDATVVEDIR